MNDPERGDDGVGAAPLRGGSSQLVLRAAFAAACLLVFGLSMMPVSEAVPLWFEGQDKLEHAGAFLAIAMLGRAAWCGQEGRLSVFLLMLGAAIEIAQGFTSYRSAELMDWLADAVGVAVALWLPWGLPERAAD